jgi:hypothetical protein
MANKHHGVDFAGARQFDGWAAGASPPWRGIHHEKSNPRDRGLLQFDSGARRINSGGQ